MRFIDLFAGLGGFHLALKRLQYQCVFACEINEELRTLYEDNYEGIKPKGDIRNIDPKTIPDHDILCAGFPCQPFSKATPTELRLGFKRPNQGNLFYKVVDILRAKEPRFFILENVLHLKRHNNEQTLQKIHTELKDLDYNVEEICLSPDELGIPQIRRRIFIVGDRNKSPSLPDISNEIQPNLDNFLDKNPSDAQKLTDRQIQCLNIWQDFLNQLPADKNLPQAPIWSMEFGAMYPYEKTTPHAMGVEKMLDQDYSRGSFGFSLKDLSEEKVWENLPVYAQGLVDHFPDWKIRFIKENRNFYNQNKKWLDKWKNSILNFPPSYQKFELNCKGEERDQWKIENFIIQFRASGVRIKKPITAPSLVAIGGNVPIIGWENRYLTPIECARLQGMACLPDEDVLTGIDKESISLPKNQHRAFTALGNAVNVDVVEHVAKALTSTNG